MRILLITHFFPPRHNAGTENYTLGLAKSLQANGNNVQVLCAEDWGSGKTYLNGVTEEKYQDVLVRRIHLNWSMAEDPNRVLYYSEKVKIWLSQFLEKESFDIVHVMSAYSFGVGIMESVKNAKLPLILTLMDFWFLCPSVQLLRSDGELCDGLTTALECQTCLMAGFGITKKLTKFRVSSENQARVWGLVSRFRILSKQRGFRGGLLNMGERKRLLMSVIGIPDRVLTHSRVVKEMFARHTGRRVQILRNGHDLSWLKSYVGKTHSDKLRIGYVGQIIPIKGVHILVEAFRKANLNNKAKLEIWGGLEKDPGYTHNLEELINGDTSISLLGRFAHDDLAQVFSGIDILVVPSIWYENAPLVIWEAFAAGTPVIATNLGGMAEMISNEVNGLLFERGDANDLARQLERFFDEPDLLEKLKAEIPKVKSVDEEVLELESIYRELLASGTKSIQ